MSSSTFRNGLLVLVSLFVGGCGGGGAAEPVLVPVNGKVTINGKPVPGVTLSFVPSTSVGGNGASGTSNEAGEYTLMYRNGKAGAIPGKYNVLFSRLTLPDGSPMPKDAMAADVGAVEQIPEKYRNMDMAIHYVEIKAEGGSFDFDLKLK